MMRRSGGLLRDSRGISALEFALVAPVLVLLIVGLVQMGRLFFAEADLEGAVAGGSRFATIFPRPSDDDILDRVEEELTGLNPDLLVNEIRYGRDRNGDLYAELSAAYDVDLNFIFFEKTGIRLQAQRRVYVQENNGAPTAPPGGSTSTSASGGTSSGTTTSSTSSGTTTSTSSGTTTTSTSSGTTTTSTSSGTTTTSTSSGTTTTSTGGSTSSGNGNGNGNGNGHGNGGSPPGKCRRCA